MDMVQMGSFLAELRKEKNLTQAELGEKLGVTNKTISRWETGNYMIMYGYTWYRDDDITIRAAATDFDGIHQYSVAIGVDEY